MIVSGSLDNSVRIWNIREKRQEAIILDLASAARWNLEYPEMEIYFNMLD